MIQLPLHTIIPPAHPNPKLLTAPLHKLSYVTTQLILYVMSCPHIIL
jgi:hypothetical protein